MYRTQWVLSPLCGLQYSTQERMAKKRKAELFCISAIVLSMADLLWRFRDLTKNILQFSHLKTTKNILCTRRRLHRIVHPYGLISIFGENDLAGPPKVSASHMATGRGSGPLIWSRVSRFQIQIQHIAIGCLPKSSAKKAFQFCGNCLISGQPCNERRAQQLKAHF